MQIIVTDMHLSALKTSYMWSSIILFSASFWNSAGEGAKSVYLYPKSSSDISPVIITLMSVAACSGGNEDVPPTDDPPQTEDQDKGTGEDDPVTGEGEAVSQNEKINEDTVIGKWQYEDGSFTYELLKGGTLVVTGPNGTDDSCTRTLDNGTVNFHFSDTSGSSYTYNAEQNILENAYDTGTKLIRAD